MSWDNTNFAEGDSGVPIPPPGHYVKIYNDIEAEKQKQSNKPTGYSSMDAVTALADIIGAAKSIARNKSNDALARATALDVERQAIMDQIHIGVLYQD